MRHRGENVGRERLTVLLAALAVCGCGGPQVPDSDPQDSPVRNKQGAASMAIEITSSAFSDGQCIPIQYTGDGADQSPPLRWSAVPEGTQELALICDDPDAPTPEPWVHWILYKLPAEVTSLSGGIPNKEKLAEPAGAVQGKNSFSSGDTIGYRGPAPPKGHGVHHYHFKLYALDTQLNLSPGADKIQLLQAIDGHILAEGELIGTYAR